MSSFVYRKSVVRSLVDKIKSRLNDADDDAVGERSSTHYSHFNNAHNCISVALIRACCVLTIFWLITCNRDFGSLIFYQISFAWLPGSFPKPRHSFVWKLERFFILFLPLRFS